MSLRPLSRIRHALARLTGALAVLTLGSCGGSTGPATPGAPASLGIVSGNSQTAVVGAVVGTPLTVKVTDAAGRGVPGITVTWSVTAGNGSVSPPSTLTDGTGTASTTFTVGTAAGPEEVTASVAGVGAVQKFSITGTPGPASRVTVSPHLLGFCKADTGRVSGAVTDQFGNAVAGAVTWVSRNPAVATVDATGGVHMLNAGSTTYVVAQSGSFPADSAQVAAAATTTLALGQVLTTVSGGVCVQSNAVGSEYTIVAYSNSGVVGANTSIEVTGDGLGTVGVSASVAHRRAGGGVAAQFSGGFQPNDAFEAGLRDRERREMTPERVAAARAWYRVSHTTKRAASPNLSLGGAQSAAAPPNVGDFLTLNTNSTSTGFCANPTFVTARVVAITNTAVILADTTNPVGGFTDAEYASFGVAMDTIVNPVDTTAFGTPSDIDNNGRTMILFTKAVNQLTGVGAPNGITLGFFYGRDLLPKAGCAGSNFAEMFYLLVPDVAGTINGGNSISRSKTNVANNVVGTIAHEYQHLINASRRMYINFASNTNEETWLNEGLSHEAEELIFYRSSGRAPRQNINGPLISATSQVGTAFTQFMNGNAGRYRQYLLSTESKAPDGPDDLAMRGAIWSLLRYLADRLHPNGDGNFWFLLVNSNTTGMANLASVVGSDPSPLMRDWATSVFADDTAGVASAYMQPSWNWRSVYPTVNSNFPLTPRTMVNDVTVPVTITGGGVSYFRFTVPNGQKALIAVNGQGATLLPASIQLALLRNK